jgi:hypothetical protein
MEQVWRILVANRGPNGLRPPYWYRKAAQSYLEWYDHEAEDTFNTNDLKGIPGLPDEFLHRVQQVVWNRTVIRTQTDSVNDQPFIGLAPQGSQRGDIICIFFGCSVPVVLRGQDNGEFQFVGECYVHGVMDGEAVDPIPAGSKEVWFEMR